MNKIIKGLVAMSAILALTFTSCKSGDDDDYEPLSPEEKDLVSASVPSEGWSGNPEQGVLKFAPSHYDDEDFATYFAFNMKGGVCENGVINIVMESSLQAKQMAQMLNNGTWVDTDEDDEDYALTKAKSQKSQRRAFDVANSLLRHVTRDIASRSSFTLPIPVKQEGKVIYIMLTNVKGLTTSEIKTVVDLWSGLSNVTPDRVIFGSYVNGIYTCKNMHGMNIDYVVETKFNTSGFCTKYTTSITLPNENWAEFYYEAYEDQMWDFEQQFGERPDLKKVGNTVILDAVIFGDVPKDQIDLMIYSLDWINNCPFIYNLFGD